jgi:cytochrome c553
MKPFTVRRFIDVTLRDKIMRKLIAISILALCGMNVAQADDVAEGAKLFTEKACLSCHGEGGNKPLMPNYPKLAGQNADYTLQQMKDIKSGARNNGQTAVMKGIVAAVTDEEFAKIAKYLEAQGATAPAAAATATPAATPAPAEAAPTAATPATAPATTPAQ